MPKLLLVEDNEVNRDLLYRRLTRRGYEVVLATDGAQGLRLAESERPDLVLMDLGLPVLDGWEATRRLKGADGTRAIPVIALTAHAMHGDETRARDAGCDDFDTKPVDLERLLAKIEALLPRPATPLAIERPATREHLADLLAFARDACERAGLGEPDAHDVRLVAEELCANVVAYGYADGEPGPLSLAIEVARDVVRVRVEDRASRFDLLGADEPARDEPWSTRRIGGLGLFLVRELASDVRHEAREGGGNRVTVVLRRSGVGGRA